MADTHITFRPACPEDIDRIMEIETLSGGRWTRENFVTEFRNSFSAVTVAVYKDEIIGYAVIWHIAGEVQLNNIAVHPDFRRNKTGTHLIEHIIRETAFRNPRTILIEVNEKNHGALRFYRKMNFRETGIRRRYYDDDDAILMEKEL